MLLLAAAACAFAKGGAESAGAPGKEKITISTNIYNTNLDYEKDETFRWVKQSFNVDFRFLQLAQADNAEKVQIWMASGDMPDVLNWEIKYFHMPQFNQWVKAGAVRALPTDLSKYPNFTKRFLDQMSADELFMVDGKRFALPKGRSYTYMPSEQYQYLWEVGHTVYRRDWAKKLGLYKEGDVYTWDEAMAMAKAFVDKDPGGLGPGKTIGYVMPEYGFTQGFTGLLQFSGDYPGYREGYVLKNGKYVWAASLTELVDGIKAFRRIVKDGVLYKDMPAAKGNVAMDRYYAGEAGMAMIYTSMGQIKTYRTKMMDLLKMNVEQAREASALMHIRLANGSLFALPVDDYFSVSLFNPKMSDAKMDRYLQVMDWACTTEGALSANYGPKGKGWSIDEKGNVKLLWNYDEKAKKFLTPDYVVNGWTNYWTFNHDDNYTLPRAFDKVLTETKSIEDGMAFLDKYKGRIYGNTVPDNYVKYFSGTNYNKYGNFAAAVHEKIVQIVYSDIPDDRIADAWAEWVKGKMSQVQPILDELNAGLKK